MNVGGVLHVVDLHANTLMKNMFNWIHWRIEPVQVEIAKCRLPLAREIDREEEAKEALSECIQSLASYEEQKQEFELVGTLNQDEELELADLKLIIVDTKKERTELDKALKKAKAKTKKAVTAVNQASSKKEYGALTQANRQGIDEKLERAFHLFRASHHGGDFLGGGLREAMKKSKPIMDVGLEVVKEEEDAKADEAEINHYFLGNTIQFQLFGLMSSMCYQPYGSLTDEDMETAKRIVTLFNKMWRLMFPSVPPKTHMWDHLLENLELTRGMKFHNKNPVEVEHQIGTTLERRLAVLGI